MKLRRGALPVTIEDMEIAMAYHDATTPVRNVIAKLLRTREYRTASDPDLRPEPLVVAYEIEQLTARDQEFIRQVLQFAIKDDDDQDVRR